MIAPLPTPVPAVGVVCLRGDSVLLIRRGTPPRQGEWSLPGGRLEPGETAEDCAARELREELGVRVAALRPVARLVLGESRFRLQVFGTESFDGAIAPNDEIAAWQWVRRGEEAGLSTTPHLSEVLVQAFGLFDRS